MAEDVAVCFLGGNFLFSMYGQISGGSCSGRRFWLEVSLRVNFVRVIVSDCKLGLKRGLVVGRCA